MSVKCHLNSFCSYLYIFLMWVSDTYHFPGSIKKLSEYKYVLNQISRCYIEIEQHMTLDFGEEILGKGQKFQD